MYYLHVLETEKNESSGAYYVHLTCRLTNHLIFFQQQTLRSTYRLLHCNGRLPGYPTGIPAIMPSSNATLERQQQQQQQHSTGITIKDEPMNHFPPVLEYSPIQSTDIDGGHPPESE